MAEQQLTYESVLEMIREANRSTNRSIRRTSRLIKEQGAEFDRKMQKTELQMKATDKKNLCPRFAHR